VPEPLSFELPPEPGVDVDIDMPVIVAGPDVIPELGAIPSPLPLEYTLDCAIMDTLFDPDIDIDEPMPPICENEAPNILVPVIIAVEVVVGPLLLTPCPVDGA
jgi:hypothetical protein